MGHGGIIVTMSDKLFELYGISVAPLNGESFLTDIDDLDDDDMDLSLVTDELEVFSGLASGASKFLEYFQQDPKDKKTANYLLAVYLKRLETMSRKFSKIVTTSEKTDPADYSEIEALIKQRSEKKTLDDSHKNWADVSATIKWADPKLKEKSSSKKDKHVHIEDNKGTDLEKGNTKMRKGTGFVRLSKAELGLDSESDNSSD